MSTTPTSAAGEVEALSQRIRALSAEIESLRTHLRESEEIVLAIRGGAVDAVVVGEPEKERVYTLAGADHPYRLLVENMQEGAVTLGEDGTILYANQSFARIVGTPLQKVIGAPFEQFVSPVERSRLEAFFAEASRGKGELTLQSGGGGGVPVYLSRSSVDLGGMRGICMVVTDLTEQKRHEEISASERLARSILEQAAEAIVVCNDAGRVTHASRQAEVLCGRNPLWQPFDAVFPLRYVEDAGRAADAPADPPGSSHGSLPGGREVIFSRSDGRTYYLLLSSAPLQGEGERALGTVHILTDITERKDAAEALRESERKLKTLNESLEERVTLRTAELSRVNLALTQKNRELQDFAYVASHDLQEPLRKIISFSNLFNDEYQQQVDENGRLYLDRIQDAARRMSDLIRDLLSFSRIATHGQPFRRVDLGAIFAEVQADLDLAIAEAKADVVAGPLPVVEGDPFQMRQLFHHLVANALKFRRAGVAPVIHVRAEVQGGTEVGDGTRPVAVLEVEDNGIGFDEKYLDRIFTPFQRLHGRGQYGGTGMGLAICRRIVERHHGRITARSVPGEGAVFEVTLPLRQG